MGIIRKEIFNKEIRIRILKNLDDENYLINKRNEIVRFIDNALKDINIGKWFYSEGNKAAFLYDESYEFEVINITIKGVCDEHVGVENVDYTVYFPDLNDYEELNEFERKPNEIKEFTRLEKVTLRPLIPFDNDFTIRIGKVVKDYYNQIDKINITEIDFEEWLYSLNEPMQSDFRKKGYKACQSILNFQRYCLEIHDFGMDDFLKTHLSKEDYNFWTSNS